MQSALKDIFGPMFETVLKGELNHHLVYDSNDEGEKPSPNRRCGNDKKTLHTSAGERKWEGGHIQNWSMVMNQLLIHKGFGERVHKYI